MLAGRLPRGAEQGPPGRREDVGDVRPGLPHRQRPVGRAGSAIFTIPFALNRTSRMVALGPVGEILDASRLNL